MHVFLSFIHSLHEGLPTHQPPVLCLASLQVDGQKTSKAKQKGCGELAPWIQSISNRLWWCKGNQR